MLFGELIVPNFNESFFNEKLYRVNYVYDFFYKLSIGFISNILVAYLKKFDIIYFSFIYLDSSGFKGFILVNKVTIFPYFFSYMNFKYR